MATLFSNRKVRWAAPAVVAACVAAGAVTLGNSAGASDQPNLPPRTAAQLLASVEQAHPSAMSGTIVETANFGLPSLPAGDLAGGGLSWQSLLTGSHTMRIWYAGPGRQRIAILAPMSERDIIHNGSNLWTFTSTTNEVTHSVLPRHSSAAGHSSMPETGPTPQQAAELALHAISPSTRVTVDRTGRVAGRPVYQLKLTPRDSRSLIGSVRIAIDSATSLPLRVQIFAAGSSSPALQIGFTDISLGTPNAAVFNFVPPSGATVKQQGLQSLAPDMHGQPGGSHRSANSAANSGPKLLGNGWTAVLELNTGQQLTGNASNGMLNELSKPTPHGRLITTSLLSVLLTNDGHVFVGPVSAASIQHVAATGHGL